MKIEKTQATTTKQKKTAKRNGMWQKRNYFAGPIEANDNNGDNEDSTTTIVKLPNIYPIRKKKKNYSNKLFNSNNKCGTHSRIFFFFLHIFWSLNFFSLRLGSHFGYDDVVVIVVADSMCSMEFLRIHLNSFLFGSLGSLKQKKNRRRRQQQMMENKRCVKDSTQRNQPKKNV